MLSERWLLPSDYQLSPQATESCQANPLCVELTLDGYTTLYAVNHRMRISAADLAAGYPLVEIINPQTNPIPASTGATRTTLTGAQALVGVTVSSSLSNQLILAFSTPAAAPAGTTIQILLTRNPATQVGYP
jgi:hypothetical protein